MSLRNTGPLALAAILNLVTAQTLGRVLPEHWRPIRNVHFQILRRHRTRCTFEISWPGADGQRAVIGKAYATDREDVYRAMATIWRVGFASDEAFSIPQPITYVPELKLLLQEKVHGPRAKDGVLTGTERDRLEVAERCAHWLARFQAMAAPEGQAYRVNDVLDSVNEWSRAFGAADELLADKATRLREQLEAAVRGLRPTELCAGHGHYSIGQVLLAHDRTVTVDWDGHDVADPCRDVATFVVDLRRIGAKNPGAIPALDQTLDRFLATYCSLKRSGIRANLPFYAAARCLRLAHKDVDHRKADWAKRAAAMLDEGLRVLERGL